MVWFLLSIWYYIINYFPFLPFPKESAAATMPNQYAIGWAVKKCVKFGSNLHAQSVWIVFWWIMRLRFKALSDQGTVQSVHGGSFGSHQNPQNVQTRSLSLWGLLRSLSDFLGSKASNPSKSSVRASVRTFWSQASTDGSKSRRKSLRAQDFVPICNWSHVVHILSKFLCICLILQGVQDVHLPWGTTFGLFESGGLFSPASSEPASQGLRTIWFWWRRKCSRSPFRGEDNAWEFAMVLWFDDPRC